MATPRGSITYPAGGDPIWTEDSLAADLIRAEFFGASEPEPGAGVVGSLTATLPAPSLLATALARATAQASITLPAPGIASTASSRATGSASPPLSAPSFAIAGAAPAAALLDGALPAPGIVAEGTSEAPQEPEIRPTGGFTKHGFYAPRYKKKREDEAPALEVEVVEVTPGPSAPRPVVAPPARVATNPQPVAFIGDEAAARAAAERAWQEYHERDDDDAMALLLILAAA